MKPSLSDLIAIKDSVSRRLGGPQAQLPADKLPGRQNRPIRVSDAVGLAGHNVHAVGVGLKKVGGVPTGSLCVRLYVHRKLPESLIAPVHRLPRALDGIPTDVIQSGHAVLYAKARAGGKKAVRRKVAPGHSALAASVVQFAAHATPAASIVATGDCGTPTGTFRPIRGGIGGANSDVYLGTLGCVCESRTVPDDLYVLSCYHVLADTDGGQPVNTVSQPCFGEIVADYFYGQALDNGDNTMDAAIAKLLPGFARDAVADICGIGALKEVERVRANGVQVRKAGAATGLRHGTVTDCSYNPTVRYGNCVIQARDQMRIEAPAGQFTFADEGDSGSIVVLEDRPVGVGMIIGGDYAKREYAVASHLEPVLERLGVRLLGGA